MNAARIEDLDSVNFSPIFKYASFYVDLIFGRATFIRAESDIQFCQLLLS